MRHKTSAKTIQVQKINQKPGLKLKFIKAGTTGIAFVTLLFLIIFLYNNIGITGYANAKYGSTTRAGMALQLKSNSLVSGTLNNRLPSNFTIMGWVNPSEINRAANILSLSAENAGTGDILLFKQTDRNYFEYIVITKKGPEIIHSETVIQPDKWYHFALTYDKRSVRIYINGLLDSEKEIHSPIKSRKNLSIRIGNQFAGSMDELSIWNEALTVEQVQNRITKKVEKGNKKIFACFPLDEGYGDISNDLNTDLTLNIKDAEWVRSGAPVCNEASFQTKNDAWSYSYTYSNGYAVEVFPGSNNPDAVLFYYINDPSEYISKKYPNFTFGSGYMGIYVINKKGPVIYHTSFTDGTHPEKSPATASSLVNDFFIVLTRPSADHNAWKETSVSGIKESFEFSPETMMNETALGTMTKILSDDPGKDIINSDPYCNVFRVKYASSDKKPATIQLLNAEKTKIYENTIDPVFGYNYYTFLNSSLQGEYHLNILQDGKMRKNLQLIYK